MKTTAELQSMAKRQKQKIPRIVVVGGGTGTFVVLTALRNCKVPLPPHQKVPLKTKTNIPVSQNVNQPAKDQNFWCGGLHLTAIVTVADSGGSSGELRDQYGVLPPGDVRRALVALSVASPKLRNLFNYRFDRGRLKGHSFGNLFITALEQVTGSFANAIKGASEVLNVKGEVIPVTLGKVTLCARIENNRIIRGEANIDVRKRDPHIPIKRIWLEPQAKINADARRAILSADLIIIGPGDLYTSLIPNLLVKGVVPAIRNSNAKKVYVCNLMTKYGETHGFEAQDFLNVIEKYLGKGVLDYAIFNNKKPSASVLRRYRKENAFFVDPSSLNLQSKKPKIILADLIEPSRFIRHDPRKKLAKALLSLI